MQRFPQPISGPILFVKRAIRAVSREFSKWARRPFVILSLKRSLTNPKINEQGFILVFAPEAAVVPHFSAICVLAKTLVLAGHNVRLARCFEVFRRCITMTALRLPYVSPPEVLRRTCMACADAAWRMTRAYGLSAIDLRHYASAEIRSIVAGALQQAPDNLQFFEYDSIPFGKVCMAELVLETKAVLGEKISHDVRIAWLKYIESALTAYLILDRICREHAVSRILYFNDYSLNMSARLVAEKYGIPCLTVSLASHKNVDRRRYVFLPQIARAIYFQQRSLWPKWQKLALSPVRVREMTDDMIVRFSGRGSHVLSPAKTLDDIRTALSLSKSRKLLVAYTSSLDEIIAGFTTSEAVGHRIDIPRQPFGSDLEQVQSVWLRSLIKYVETSDDLQLVVRVHPREGAVKGDPAIAERLAMMKAEFDRTLPNCRFVWPEEPVSSYDLGEAADVVLVGWSTIGVEMARLGVPVLACTYGVSPFPNDEFLEFVDNESGYFEKLEQLLQRPPSVHPIAKAYRWASLFYLGNSLDLSDVVPDPEFPGLPDFKLPRESKNIDAIVMGRKTVLDINYEALAGAQSAASDNDERMALSAQFRRLVHLICTGQTSDDEGLSIVTADPALDSSDIRSILSKLPHTTRTIVAIGNEVHYRFNQDIFSRYSPMASRLARLGASERYSLQADLELIQTN